MKLAEEHATCYHTHPLIASTKLPAAKASLKKGKALEILSQLSTETMTCSLCDTANPRMQGPAESTTCQSHRIHLRKMKPNWEWVTRTTFIGGSPCSPRDFRKGIIKTRLQQWPQTADPATSPYSSNATQYHFYSSLRLLLQYLPLPEVYAKSLGLGFDTV